MSSDMASSWMEWKWRKKVCFFVFIWFVDDLQDVMQDISNELEEENAKER